MIREPNPFVSVPSAPILNLKTRFHYILCEKENNIF